MAEIIEIQNSDNNSEWTPFVGDETTGLLRSKGFANTDGSLNEGGQRVLDEAYRIMQVCGDPNEPANNDTGIVIGYVQSGKTLSFTTLTALARDNNYRIVIIIAGTTTPLVNQSTERVKKDLRVNDRYGFEQKWTQIKNPRTQEDFDIITGALDQWADQTFPNDRCRTILITVMKNGSHLRNLTDLLSGIDLSGVPTLIIDDESDQASLNTRARWAARQGIDIEALTENQVSTIYRRITGLRNIFPHHTFLQYTATPQANLFINIVDRLSPNFIKLLTPGGDYIGGIQFFRENPNLIREIPLNTIPNMNEPPDALLDALRYFYLGVAAGMILEAYKLPGQHNRSMLIHPSRLQGDHTTFYGWVNTIKESWRRLLSGDDEDEKSDLLNAFRITYNDLQMTVPDLPSFDILTGNDLIHAIQYTPIVEVNSRRGATPQINWQDYYSWILVGGQSMDRGFTIEGLTVTYMPRNIGVGNVDTIQQRARFFGYKRSYLGYCRVFLDQVTIDAYTYIVEHEEDVRNRLVDFDINNKHLNDWDREAVLDQILNLTRANILYDDLDRDQFGNDWFRINAPHDTEEHIATNRNAVFEFLEPKSELFLQDEGHINRTEDQKHLVATIPMKDCLEHLLNKLKFTRESDSARYSSLRGIIKRYSEENPNGNCKVYLMSADSLIDWKRRIRRLNSHDEIQQLFQGRNPRTGEVIYPGDSEIKDENVLTIQIHMLNIRDTEYTDVSTLAIWVPESMSQDIIRQV
ncbi:Z1 domain-containing protein [Bacteroides sp. 224]|uniref:Z1 domain-containing protein n=1 Tax=Bacteroides sp. 224 TaxID=2302936 RepID=UPI0013D18131|nr:Z1 domain-containing protein [Bacteroides sp. 224]NDV66102.1 alpha-1,4 polygalactosaminidase [Bacteroides sp. 224]